MQRILSGMRPTGGIHLGNYLGYLKQAVLLSQEAETECFFMAADYHALLSFRETPLKQGSLDLFAWELAAGLEPQKSTLFLQSLVPAHTELNWIFNTLIYVSELNRMTQFKDLVARGLEQPNAALLTYPILQAADVLLYKANFVPVGRDQVQHLELTRTIARRFNSLTQTNTFPEPQPKLTESAVILDLQDPSKKMAKSVPQGALLLEDDETALRQKISRAVTDTGLTEIELPEETQDSDLSPEVETLLLDHMSPGVKNLFVILKEVSPSQDVYLSLLENYRHKNLRYQDLKSALIDAVVAFTGPLQNRYKEIRADEKRLEVLAHEGSAKARQVADATLSEVKSALHLLT